MAKKPASPRNTKRMHTILAKVVLALLGSAIVALIIAFIFAGISLSGVQSMSAALLCLWIALGIFAATLLAGAVLYCPNKSGTKSALATLVLILLLGGAFWGKLKLAEWITSQKAEQVSLAAIQPPPNPKPPSAPNLYYPPLPTPRRESGGYGPTTTKVEVSGNGSTANPGTTTAPVHVEPCGVFQNGGSNNSASPQCTPLARHLTDFQAASVRSVMESLPGSVKVMVETIGGNGEAQRYAQQFQDIAVQYGRSGNPKAVIMGLSWRVVPVGLYIVTKSDTTIPGIYREKLGAALESNDVKVDKSAADWVKDDELYIVVGEQPQ